jgi:Protein of unknown function (DUF2939)
MRRPNLTPPRPVSSEPRAVGTRVSGPQLPEPPSFRAMRNTALALGALVFAGFFVGAPYKSADKLGGALQSGDPKKLEEVIDFAALREDLKEQLASALAGGAPKEERARAGLEVIGGAFVNSMIDMAVQPESFAKLKDAPIDADVQARLRLAMRRARVGYESPLAFSIRVIVADVSDEPIHLTMGRTGLFTWKVKGVTLPKDLSRLQQLEPQLAPGVEQIGPGKYRAIVRAD